MADTYTLADLMRERAAQAPQQPQGALATLGNWPSQDLDALANSLPPAPPALPFPDNLAHLPSSAHEWLTRNVLEPMQYAGFYPVRVLERAYPDWPVPAHEKPTRVGLRRRMGEGSKYGGPLPINEIDAMSTYTPGQRESENVEDRRPRSIWE